MKLWKIPKASVVLCNENQVNPNSWEKFNVNLSKASLIQIFREKTLNQPHSITRCVSGTVPANTKWSPLYNWFGPLKSYSFSSILVVGSMHIIIINHCLVWLKNSLPWKGLHLYTDNLLEYFMPFLWSLVVKNLKNVIHWLYCLLQRKSL